MTDHKDIIWYTMTDHNDIMWYTMIDHNHIIWYTMTDHNHIIWYTMADHNHIIWYTMTDHNDIIQVKYLIRSIPLGVRVMVFYSTFNNTSVISWQSVLLVEEIWVPRENHQTATNHWQTLSHHVVLTIEYTLPWVIRNVYGHFQGLPI
jgi:hypothetical protein